MSLKEKIIALILKGRVMSMLDGLKDKLEGKKTYITAVVGVLVGLVAFFFGPVDLAGVNIPAIDSSQLWGVIWEAAMLVFLRKGVSK